MATELACSLNISLLSYDLKNVSSSGDLFQGRIAISWTVDFLMVVDGPTSTALDSNVRLTNANFFTKLRLSTLWELLLLDLRLTTLWYHAQQLWIVFVLWARMLLAAQTCKVEGFADGMHITSVRVMHCGRKWNAKMHQITTIKTHRVKYQTVHMFT